MERQPKGNAAPHVDAVKKVIVHTSRSCLREWGLGRLTGIDQGEAGVTGKQAAAFRDVHDVAAGYERGTRVGLTGGRRLLRIFISQHANTSLRVGHSEQDSRASIVGKFTTCVKRQAPLTRYVFMASLNQRQGSAHCIANFPPSQPL